MYRSGSNYDVEEVKQWNSEWFLSCFVHASLDLDSSERKNRNRNITGYSLSNSAET